MMKKQYIPNVITGLRILGTLVLLLLRPFTPAFAVLYAVTGVTDVLDGSIARRFHWTSDFGARLDSISDLLFYAVMLVKIFPALLHRMPRAFWYLLTVVLAIRLLSYAVAGAKFRCFASLHTYGNKLTGLLVFLTPYVLLSPVGVGYCFAACTVALAASAEELLLHLLAREYDPSRKTLLYRNR